MAEKQNDYLRTLDSISWHLKRIADCLETIVEQQKKEEQNMYYPIPKEYCIKDKE